MSELCVDSPALAYNSHGEYAEAIPPTQRVVVAAAAAECEQGLETKTRVLHVAWIVSCDSPVQYPDRISRIDNEVSRCRILGDKIVLKKCGGGQVSTREERWWTSASGGTSC